MVGPREALETRKVVLRELNWLGDGDFDAISPDGVELFAKVRSTRQPMPAVLRNVGGRAEVELTAGEQGVARGQACVLYDGDGDGARVFGGGFIARSERSAEAETMLRRIAV